MAALEIGCGRHRHPQCDTFMDANTNIPGLDYYGDAFAPMPWPDGSFDLIVATDVLEHGPYRSALGALAEWARLLAPGGRLYVQVPDCGRIMSEWVANPERWNERLPVDLQGLPSIVGVAWRIMGGQHDGNYTFDGDDWRLNAHFSMWTEDSFRWYAGRAGLEIESLESNPHPNLCVWLRKPPRARKRLR